jgi:hypothetical protein
MSTRAPIRHRPDLADARMPQGERRAAPDDFQIRIRRAEIHEIVIFGP